jgi:hypothetical protein
MRDNQMYVMYSTAGNGQIRVWKWNGANPPSVVGSANVGATSGNVQAMSFDNGNPDQAYIFGRVADANEGEVYEVNLTNAAATKLFKLPRYEADKPLTGIWTIQVESFDSDRYFIFGGSVFAPPRGQTGESKHGVFVVKNPPSDGSAITSTTMFQTLVEFPTAVRTMKSFLVNAHDIVYAAKNYTDGANYHQTDYKLRLIEVKDD